MFGSAIVDVLIGVVSAFLGVSLAASAITEAINSLFRLRQKTLVSGLGQMLNDTAFTGLALDVLNHGLVNPLGSGAATTKAGLTAQPAYVDAAQFATGFLAIVRGAGDEAKLAASVGNWFDSSMERVSGEFKRFAQLISFVAALAVAAALNVDGLHITQELWQRPVLAESLPAGGAVTSEAALGALKSSTLIGWDGFADSDRNIFGGRGTAVGFASMLLGWLIVAGAALFGAPFWFDTLQRITQLRGVGGGAGVQDRPATQAVSPSAPDRVASALNQAPI
jgi:hypothetical protein